jgi:transcription-repair coupling factor (superfamily II helicase)
MRIAAIKLDAAALGIEKIDASAAGGFLQFGRRAAVDPAVLVQLVQSGRAYRMQGADRLQFRVEMPKDEDRFETVEKLLHHLGQSAGANRALAG